MVADFALFRFKIGMIPTLASCSGLGLLIYAWPQLDSLIEQPHRTGDSR
jgi:hypothetical protein